jgi:hypothetical protein
VHSLFCVALKSKEKQIQREFATMAWFKGKKIQWPGGKT